MQPRQKGVMSTWLLPLTSVNRLRGEGLMPKGPQRSVQGRRGAGLKYKGQIDGCHEGLIGKISRELRLQNIGNLETSGNFNLVWENILQAPSWQPTRFHAKTRFDFCAPHTIDIFDGTIKTFPKMKRMATKAEETDTIQDTVDILSACWQWLRNPSGSLWQRLSALCYLDSSNETDEWKPIQRWT